MRQASDLKEDGLKSIFVKCPICKASHRVEIPKSIVNEAEQLTTASIGAGVICEHGFQVYVDKNFAVRGYEKVDIQINSARGREDRQNQSARRDHSSHLLEEIELNGNNVRYDPKRGENVGRNKQKKEEQSQSLEERDKEKERIYEEFWEFISDNNEDFMEFIAKDERRKGRGLPAFYGME